MSALRENDCNPRPGLAVLRDIVGTETAATANRGVSAGEKPGQASMVRVVYREAREIMDMA